MKRTITVTVHKEAPALAAYCKDNNVKPSNIGAMLINSFLEANGYDVEEYDAAYKASLVANITTTDWSK